MDIGLDEVGRGAWAGPLVFAGAVLESGFDHIADLKDSKDLSPKQRKKLYDVITEKCTWAVSVIENEIIDKYGLTKASEIACNEVIKKISLKREAKSVILDGNINYLKNSPYEDMTICVIKADSTIPVVMAASIVAKVTRDLIMAEYDISYPGYGFLSNVGYGTKFHKEALEKIGLTSLHRKSFMPMRALS